MGVSDYIKRALTEITQPSTQSPRFSVRQSVLLAVTVGIFALGFVGWALGLDGKPSSKAGAGECAFRVSKADAPAPVTEGDATDINICVKLERVASPSSRQLGLSNRPSLAWDRGMLFDYQQPNQYCMWMKDMHFSLDMLWLNEQYEIIAMREQISPDTYPRSFCGPETAYYVVEVNAGIVQAGDLRLGQHLNL